MATEHGLPGPAGRPVRVARTAALLQSFYAGEEVPCPIGCGGMVHAVRVGTLGDGGGDLWLECGCCAQRERVVIPPATMAERLALQLTLAPGATAFCPRHAGRVPLRQYGRRLVCPECGVRFRE
jgi:hypothetical protein